MRVIESSLCLETIDPVLSWVDRVIKWNPCNSELIPTSFTRPCAYKLAGDILIAHPVIIAEMKRLASIQLALYNQLAFPATLIF